MIALAAAYCLGAGLSIVGGELLGFLLDAGYAADKSPPSWLRDGNSYEVLGVLSLAAVAEEFLFRKLGITVLRRDGLSDLASVTLTSVAFGAAHSWGGAEQVIGAFCGGLLLGWVFIRSRHGLSLAVSIHLGVNHCAYIVSRSYPPAGNSAAVLVPLWVDVGALVLLILGFVGIRLDRIKYQAPTAIAA